MFTGLIEAVCTTKAVRRSGAAMILTIDLGPLAQNTKTGDSIAINGTCLTVTALKNTIADFDLSPETLEKSTLKDITVGKEVNAERALSPTARFGGHFVLGHVDGFATLKNIEQIENFYNLTFTAPPELMNSIIPKGSVAIDGISLTIAELDDTSFKIAVIPETWKNTSLNTLKVGDPVNIETDIIVKTVKAQLNKILPADAGLTIEKLREAGF